jgi:hypothetical protein
MGLAAWAFTEMNKPAKRVAISKVRFMILSLDGNGMNADYIYRHMKRLLKLVRAIRRVDLKDQRTDK